MKYYTPKYFAVQEYIPPEIYKELGDKSILLMDYRVLITDDLLREYFDVAITINNWHTGGNRVYSGFRPAYCQIGAKWSQHRLGRASDKIFKGIGSEIIRKEIIANQVLFPYIRVIENNTSWIHTDCRCITDELIQIINP